MKAFSKSIPTTDGLNLPPRSEISVQHLKGLVVACLSLPCHENPIDGNVGFSLIIVHDHNHALLEVAGDTFERAVDLGLNLLLIIIRIVIQIMKREYELVHKMINMYRKNNHVVLDDRLSRDYYYNTATIVILPCPCQVANSLALVSHRDDVDTC